MALTAPKLATYSDLEALPANMVGEIIHGALITHPRPSPRHGEAATRLGAKLLFGSGEGDVDAWRFIAEPELHFGLHVLVPDVAGWRIERLPLLPDTAYLEVVPDWICEVLSPSTERYDRGAKRQIYATQGLKHYWLLDPRAKVLEVFELRGADWLLVGTFTDSDLVAAPPFTETPISLADIWARGA